MTNVNWVIHMIDYREQFEEDGFSWDDFAALEEEGPDQPHRPFARSQRPGSQPCRSAPLAEPVRLGGGPVLRRRETDRIEILVSDIGHAIRLLRAARWQIRCSRIKQVARNPRGCIRYWMKKSSEEWSARWLFFTIDVRAHRLEGLSWAGSVRQSLPLLLK